MKRFVLAVILCLGTLGMWAVPAKRITMEVKQPDGSVLTLTQGGDEYFSYLMTEDGVMVKRINDAYYYLSVVNGEVQPLSYLAHEKSMRSVEEERIVEMLPSSAEIFEVALREGARARRQRAAKAQKTAEVPSVGEVSVPVLLVQYTDVKFSSSDPKTTFEGHINGDDYKDEGGYGSVKEYFEDQSEGKFVPKFDVFGPITLGNKMEHYGGNDVNGEDKNARAMISEACKIANSQENIDFSRYDNDGDGYVDIVYVIYAGYGEASNINVLENTIWPHQWNLETGLDLDGVKVSKYACNNELNGYQGSTIDGIGTFCHEFSHCLGLPDFYPTNNTNAFGMESWSLMHYGNYSNNGRTPCGYTGYEKEFLGWKELVVLDAPTDVTLLPTNEGGVSYKIVNDANPDEYYVVENRKRTKWDQFLPAEGMLVIHVDYKASEWQNNFVNNYPEHQRMTIIPADNKLTKESQSGDTYPGTTGNTELTSTSKPAATVYMGDYMGKDITDISMNDGVVTFSFMKGALPVPVQHEATEVTSSGFTMSWDPAPGVQEYEVQLAILEENPYMLDEDFNNVTKGNTDIGSLLDTYTNNRGWMGMNIFGLDGAIRMGKPNEEGALMYPHLECDSSVFTVLFTIKKSEPADNDAYMIMAVGDEAWGNGLYGFGIPVDNDDWTTYFVVMDTIGQDSYFYLDTRDNDKTAGKECLRVDIDDIYLLAGDYTDEFTGGGDNAPRKLPMPTPGRSKVQATNIARMAKASAQRTGDENQEDSVATEKRYYATTIHKAITTDLTYRFDNLDGGRYRSLVRSVNDSVYSRISNAVEVEIVDSMLPKAEVALDVTIHNDSVTFIVEDSTLTIFYTLDGTVPTGYGLRYEAPFELTEKATIRVMGRKEGHRRSDLYKYDNWFEQDGATYRIGSTVTPVAYVSEAMEGNDAKAYAGHVVVGNEVIYDSLVYTVKGIEDYAFRNAVAMRTLTVCSDSLQFVGEGLFLGCKNLNAVVWDTDQPLTDVAFDAAGYNNLLVYLFDGMTFDHPLLASHGMTVVQDGACDTLVLSSQYPFYAPLPFTANHITYSRNFAQSTGFNTSAGWETITLPFDVQRFEHKVKGAIAPFGVEAAHNFWLAQPTEAGFAPATTLRANLPYIIAMPNNKEYGDFSMSGQVTFSADNATVHATDALDTLATGQYMLVPTYDKVEANKSIYALNVGVKHDKEAPGSVFAPGKYTVNPFSAYVLPAQGIQKAPYFRVQMQDDVEEPMNDISVMVEGGIVYVILPEARPITVYDLTGRRVAVVAGQEGVNVIPNLHAGFYMVEKTKVYVKR